VRQGWTWNHIHEPTKQGISWYVSGTAFWPQQSYLADIPSLAKSNIAATLLSMEAAVAYIMHGKKLLIFYILPGILINFNTAIALPIFAIRLQYLFAVIYWS
jgi:hypothetical protein